MSENDATVHFQLITALKEAEIPFTQTHHEPVYTSEGAARIRGTSLHSGAKALIVKGDQDFLLVVLPADMTLDSKALRRSLGIRGLRFASRDEVFGLTGLTPGSIPPFGSLFQLLTLCDEQLADNAFINFNAGSHTDSIQMTYADYLGYEKPRLAQVAKAAKASE